MDAQSIVGIIVAIAVPAILGVVWLIRLEGRVNTHERGCEERQKSLDERHDAMSKKLDHIDQKLDRLIELPHWDGTERRR